MLGPGCSRKCSKRALLGSLSFFKDLTILNSIEVSGKRSSRTVSASASGPDARNAYSGQKDSARPFPSCDNGLQTRMGKRSQAADVFGQEYTMSQPFTRH